MKRKLRTMFIAVEINLLLWLAVCGMALGNSDGSSAPWWRGPVQVDATLLLIGAAFAAIVQHWAYYAVQKEAGRTTTTNQMSGESSS